jgi:CHASE2 domain-containing sensor protein/serine phosphatase RsbU (regulator of sigma subunit)
VSASAAAAPARVPLLGSNRLIGIAMLFALLVAAGSESPWQRRLQLAWLDSYQASSPRQVRSMPAVVVAIDEKSLTELGQWPWPRTVMADLVKAINSAGPAAIGIDVLMPEPDRMSPARVVEHLPGADADLVKRLAALPSNDATLAQALRSAPVVLGVAGLPEAGGQTLRAVPPRVVNAGPAGSSAGDPGERLRQFAGVMTSLEELDSAAPGHGLLSAPDTEGGVVRNIPLVARVNGTLVPTLGIEMLRLATRTPVVVQAQGGEVKSVGVAGLQVPTSAEGLVWVHFSKREARRFVSAADVLAGRVPAERLAQKLVLIGATGLGLLDHQATPLGERMPGIEIHAQLLENLFDSDFLTRPAWAPRAELAALLLPGLLLIWLVPLLSPRMSVLAGAACVALVLGGGFAAYRWGGLLLDAATPGFGLLLLFGALLAASLAEATRRRKALELEVQAQREQAARVAGELEAAQRIQTGILPRAESLKNEPRVELAAGMTPAREVGGDLYDFYMLDDSRLLFMIGDVSGKGLGASMFMAVGKALYKSIGLRGASGQGDAAELAGAMMTQANREVSRENPEAMFVTAFAGILDLSTGQLAYCNAGHDDPYVLRPGSETLERLSGGDGPPLCVMDDFEYPGATRQLAPGDLLCLLTDGVSEAQNAAGDLYGNERLRAVLARCAKEGVGSAALMEAVRGDVAAFTGPVEPYDDLTMLVLRWRGPSAP